MSESWICKQIPTTHILQVLWACVLFEGARVLICLQGSHCLQVQIPIWQWVRNGTLKWKPGKWNHGLNPDEPLWSGSILIYIFGFRDLHQAESHRFRVGSHRFRGVQIPPASVGSTRLRGAALPALRGSAGGAAPADGGGCHRSVEGGGRRRPPKIGREREPSVEQKKPQEPGKTKENKGRGWRLWDFLLLWLNLLDASGVAVTLG